jgi:hypothetical protein
MDPERPGPDIACNANYRPVLSSERAPYFRVKKFSNQGRKRKNLIMAPKGEPDPKRDRPTDRQP